MGLKVRCTASIIYLKSLNALNIMTGAGLIPLMCDKYTLFGRDSKLVSYMEWTPYSTYIYFETHSRQFKDWHFTIDGQGFFVDGQMQTEEEFWKVLTMSCESNLGNIEDTIPSHCMFLYMHSIYILMEFEFVLVKKRKLYQICIWRSSLQSRTPWWRC